MANVTIVVEPQKLRSTARKIEELANDYKALYNKLYDKTDDLATTWSGKDNVAFVEQIAGFKDDLGNMYTLMRNYADFLVQSAEAYSTTQETIVTEAKKLVN